MKLLSVLLLLSCSFAFGQVPRRAPGFSLMDTVQQQHDLADYRGKYVVLEFMQSKCPHCIAFAEIVEKLMIKYRPKVQSLSIVLPPDSLATVQAYIKEHNVTIPVLFDCGQVAASYMKLSPAVRTVTFPRAFLIDPNGTIINDWAYGDATKPVFEGDGLSKELDKLLGGAKK
jgi:peroxiredoxin